MLLGICRSGGEILRVDRAGVDVDEARDRLPEHRVHREIDVPDGPRRERALAHRCQDGGDVLRRHLFDAHVTDDRQDVPGEPRLVVVGGRDSLDPARLDRFGPQAHRDRAAGLTGNLGAGDEVLF